MITIENQSDTLHPLEMWGGVECTMNRVGEYYYDQLLWNGHHSRLEDLARFADLGIQAIRYPLLWERTAPDSLQDLAWHWSDERLRLLHDLNIRPIVGLVHHGSGPRYTNLLDPAFPQKLAEYARRVAERYPWVEQYTPINEPLTTARFSGLYGHWYPHLTDARSFMRILVNEIRGTQLAMRAIREINPHAQLVQTEDLGKVYSQPVLEYQASHENERRWLTFDLLCGRVDRQHPLFDYLNWLGITAEELEEIQRDATPPDILGINYYVTSERYLDERIDLFPEWMRGGNGSHSYVDLEAVRVCQDEPAGHAGILQEAWDRYQLPMALTEVHLGAHREQQLRWWVEAWNAVHALRQRKVDVRAITAWSLLGSFNWNNLVTEDQGFYESGVFDIRGREPRPTILAHAIKAMAKKGTFDHPILDVPGWWQSADRLLHPPVCLVGQASMVPAQYLHTSERTPRQILILGTDIIAEAFQRVCHDRKIPFLAISNSQLDVANQPQLAQVLMEVQPWTVISTAAYMWTDNGAEQSEDHTHSHAPRVKALAGLCASREISLLAFSYDQTWNGTPSDPYFEREGGAPDRINAYAAGRVDEDAQILEANPRALIIHIGAFRYPLGNGNFLSEVGQPLSSLQEFITTGEELHNTLKPVNACLDLLIDGEYGIWHLTDHREISWPELSNQLICISK